VGESNKGLMKDVYGVFLNLKDVCASYNNALNPITKTLEKGMDYWENQKKKKLKEKKSEN
jgi:hypothetical protein